jgi:hypothetical protein
MLYYSLGLAVAYAGIVAFGVWSGGRLKDAINPLKWLSVLRAAIVMRLLAPHIVEQLALRLYDAECSRCVDNGRCFDCGCAMPAKAMDPFASCSKGNWGPIVFSKKRYSSIRKKYPIKITISYDRV